MASPAWLTMSPAISQTCVPKAPSWLFIEPPCEAIGAPIAPGHAEKSSETRLRQLR